MAENKDISDEEMLARLKKSSELRNGPVEKKEEKDEISDEEVVAAIKKRTLTEAAPALSETTGNTLSGGGQFMPPKQPETIGSGMLGSGQFAPVVGPASDFSMYAGVTDPDTRKGLSEKFKTITDPRQLKELHKTVPWYNIADNPVQLQSLFEWEWNEPTSVLDTIAAAGKAGMGMLESLPPLVAGAGRLGKEALAAAVYVGDPSAYGRGATLSEEQRQKMTTQEIQEAELSPRDRTIRASRAAGDAALEAGEGLLGAVTKFKEGKSMLYDKGRVAFAAATAEGLLGDPSIAPAISAEEENARRAAAIAPAMADARKNFATRINAKHVEHMQKEKNPAVLARTVDSVFNYPAVKRYAADLIENLMPPAEDAAPGFGGDIEAAKAARRAHAEEATNVAVQSMIDEANRLKEDPEQVGAIAMTTPLNIVGAGGMILGGVGKVNQAVARALKALGKTDQEINAMLSAERAAVQAQREATALAREQPGWLEKPLGSMADAADKIPGALAKIPQPVQYIGSALAGAGAGAVMSDDPLIGALKGATTGAGIKLGGKAILAAPRLGEELLKAGRLSGAELGRFEALEKMESASPAVQRFVNWSQKAGGGKALDFIEKNANVFVQHNVSMLPMMVAMGVLEDKDAQEFAQMWAEFATYGFIHGQVLGGMLGNDPIRIKMDRDAEMRQAQRVMLGFSPETRENVPNWDRVIKQSEKRLDRTQKAYFAEMAKGANTPETAKAKAAYEFAHQLHRQNLIAPPEARQAFEDNIKLSLGKVSNLINGVLTPNSNMNIELLTSSQIIDKMIAANPNFNGVGAPMTVEQALERNPTADGINISKGTAEDGFTMDPARDTVFVNVENALKKAELSGEAISNVLAHEVAGHGLFGKDDYRKRIAPLFNKMFGTEAVDENGNVQQITPAEPGMSRDDLFGKFFTKYLEGKTTEQVQAYAEAAGVWDKAANDFDKNKIVQLMREETLAEAHAGRFFGDPESPLQQGINWIASRVSSENVKSALNNLYAIAGPAVYKEWTSGKVGVTYSPEVMRAIRNVEREMKKYDGDFTDAEQGQAVAAPITRKDVIKSPDLLNKYFKDTGKFETTPVAVVTDADGKVVQTVDLKDNDAPEGSWVYHQDDATGNVVPNKEKGYGELHPELTQVQVPVGGRITVERKVAYDEATGKPKERKNKDTVEHIRQRVQMLREAIDNAGDPSELGRFRAVKGGQGKDDEDLHYTGKMTPEQRSAIAALPESVVPASMKDLLFKYDDLMTRGDGTVLDIDYAARLNDKGNYEAFSPRIRQIVPLQLHLSKAGNFYTTAWDLSALRRKVELYKKYSKGVFEPWGGDVDAFWKEFRTKLLPKLAEKPDVEKIRQDISDAFPGIAKDQFDQKVAEEYSKKASEPAWPVLDSDPETAKLKRTIYAKMLADPNPNIPGVDSIPSLPKDKFSRSEKKLDKKSDFDQIIKSYRLDAHTAAEENANTEFKYPIPYKARFMPEQEQATEEQRPAFGGGLLKGLQAISAKYNPKGTEEVRALGQPAEAQVRFMPSPAEEDYHHAEGSFPKTETSEPYKMSAIHKISDDALLFADKMGGLAVPSIAVVKAGTGIQGFGGITLVGGRDLVDPKTNPVFSGDAYTQRFPKPEYPRVKTKKAQQVIDLFKPAQSQFSHSYGDNVTDIIWDNAVNRPNPEEAVNKLKKSNVAKAAYLGKAAPEPVMRPVSQEIGILDTAPMKEWMSKNAIDNVDYANFESRKSLGDAIIKAAQELYPPESGIVKRVGRNLVDEDGQATVGAISRLERDARNYGKMEIDSAATQKALDVALTGKESEFYQWVENTIEGMYEAPRIRVAGKWEPYNLDNITRVMTSGKTAGVEKLMTQSTGLTAAQMATRFGSLQEMRNTAEAPWGIRPESEVNEARAQVSEVLRQYRDAMTPFYNGSTWDALDASMSALGAYYRSGRGGETKMKQTLSRLGFTNVPSNVVKQAVEAANAMSAAPVKYFEAKPQRVVQLNEFQGAIVPDNVDPSVLSVLQKNGIETRIIPSDKADDSAYVGSEIDKLKGGKQAQEQAGIRFMPDSEHAAAHEAKDEQKARALVDEAAKKAGYSTEKFYHGTPTGGFNEFDPALKGTMGGRARGGFSFTTDRDAAEAYSQGFSDNDVALTKAVSLVNKAFRKFDLIPDALKIIGEHTYRDPEIDIAPEYGAEHFDESPRQIRDWLLSEAEFYKDKLPELSQAHIEAAKALKSESASPEVKSVYLRLPENTEEIDSSRESLAQDVWGLDVRTKPNKAFIVNLDDGNKIAYVANSDAIKSADPFTYDNEGKLIPLSERFNAGTGDIRFMPEKEEREQWESAIEAAREAANKELNRLRFERVNTSDVLFEHQPSDDPEFGDVWSFVPPKDKYIDNTSMYDVYESGGKYYVGEGYGGGFASLNEAKEEATQRAMGESWKGSRSTFDADTDAQRAVGEIFDSFPKKIGDVTMGDGWFTTKWGSWYLEGKIPTAKGDDYDTFKLSIRDHDSGTRFQKPDKSFFVSKEWTPDETAEALKKAADWIANEAQFDAPEIGSAPIAESAAPTEGALSGVPKPFEGAQMRFNPDHKEETKKRMPMSAVEVLHKDSTVLPKPEKKRSNAEIAIQLADVAERYHGRKVTSSNITPEIENELIINGADEAEAALKASGKNAANWYSTAIQAALKVAGILHKVLTDITAAKSNPFFAKESDPLEAANFALRLPLAITSQNMTVPLNARFAEEQFNIFQQTGKFDSSKKYGGKAKSISANLNLANEMIDKLGGILELQKFVKQQFTVRDLENALSKVTGKKVGIAGRKDDIVNGAAIFGPKIGQGFLQNLMGKFDPVTIDLWMRRTWGRWTGDVVGDGVTGVRLGRMIQAFRDAGKQLPDSIKRLKTVTRSTGLTDTGKPKKPELTVTDNVEDQIESDLEFRKDLERIAKETDSEFQKHYALMSAPMSASLAKEVRSAMPVNPASPTQAELESLDKAYRKVVKVQSGIDKLLDEKFSKLTIKQKKALNSDDPKTAIKKDVWVGIQHAKAERTEKLENPEKNLLKPEWAKAAKVIVSELNPVDIPSDQDRMVISRVVNNIRQELERRGYIVTNADVQAILWYPEKDLWAKLAGKKESNLKQSYDDEFIKIAEQRGVGEQARAVARDVRGY